MLSHQEVYFQGYSISKMGRGERQFFCIQYRVTTKKMTLISYTYHLWENISFVGKGNLSYLFILLCISLSFDSLCHIGEGTTSCYNGKQSQFLRHTPKGYHGHKSAWYRSTLTEALRSYTSKASMFYVPNLYSNSISKALRHQHWFTRSWTLVIHACMSCIIL